jgi:hypothetical protein
LRKALEITRAFFSTAELGLPGLFFLQTIPMALPWAASCLPLRGGDLRIACNGHELSVIRIEESDYRTSGCMAPDRGAYSGFRTECVRIPAPCLRAGGNELTLRFGKGNSRFEAIMYGFLRMEAALPGAL